MTKTTTKNTPAPKTPKAPKAAKVPLTDNQIATLQGATQKPAAVLTDAKATAKDATDAFGPSDVYVSDRDYFLVTGKLPGSAGVRSWTFLVSPVGNDGRVGPPFTFKGAFGPAKQAAKAHFAKQGVRSVDLQAEI